MNRHLSDDEVRGLLVGALPDDQQAEAEAHLWHCADCRDSLRRQTEPASEVPPLSLTTLHVEETPTDPLESPPVISGFEIMELLGCGGMGVVWKARQLRPARTVALKVLRAGLPGDTCASQRFRAEAEALARLQHPGIVQIYEVGEWHAGGAGPIVPYFSLEFCAGGSLAGRLAGAPLPPNEAAALVVAVARAVHHAHRHGIVHRDLKPANILLATSEWQALETGEAPASSHAPLAAYTPKVTDFGLAKSMAADSAQLTRSRAILGTPSYAAPEQIEGVAGPVADVYSLGAILYECLTGRPPFKAATVLETLELARTREPLPVRQSQPGVPRDLETICLKCLEKTPARRYDSAEELADDLVRFREGRPIAARPVSRAERLRRWARRNPLVAGLAAVLALALSAGLTTALALWWNAEQHLRQEEAAHREAEDNYITCRQLLGEYVAVTRDPRLQSPDARQAQRDALHKARAFCEGLSRRRPEDAGLRRDLASVCTSLAVLDGYDGRLDEAREAGETSRTLWQELSDEAPGDTRCRDGLATALHTLGFVYDRLGRYAEAERALRQAIGLWDQLADDNVTPARCLRAAALTRCDLCILMDVEGRYEDQNKLFEHPYAWLARATDQADAPPELRLELLWYITMLGDVSRRKKDEAGAKSFWEQGRAVGRRLVEELPDNAQSWYFLALCCRYLGAKDPAAAPPEETARLFEQAVRLFEAQLRRDPADRTSARMLVDAYHGLGESRCQAGQFAEALGAGRRAVEVLAALADRHPGDLESRLNVFVYQADLARLERQCGDPLAARSTARRVADGFERFCEARTEDQPTLTLAGRFCATIAPALRHAGAPNEALRVSDHCLRLFQELTRKHPDEPLPWVGLSEAWTQRGKTLWGEERHAETEVALRAAVKASDDLAKRWPEYRQLREDRLQRLGRFLEERGRTNEAMNERNGSRVLLVLAHALGGDVKDSITVMENRRPEPYLVTSCYQDADQGTMLKIEVFREFREKFPTLKNELELAALKTMTEEVNPAQWPLADLASYAGSSGSNQRSGSPTAPTI
jgi:tetratricopeptide (TPR) repeat protein